MTISIVKKTYPLAVSGLTLNNAWVVGEHFANGSYSELYFARSLTSEGDDSDTVLVKICNPYLRGRCDVGLKETLLENHQREVQALKRLNPHRNIVKFFDDGEATDRDGIPFRFLVIEYIDGPTLRKAFDGKPAPLDKFLELYGQLCTALEYVHQGRVLHRDLKPDNILLSEDGVKLIDFSVARLDNPDGEITQVGSRFFAAPEQFNPDRTQMRLTPAADVNALAKVVYFMLSGEIPQQFAERQLTSWPLDFPPEPWAAQVLKVLRRATNKLPHVRYQSVEELKEALDEAFGEIPAEQVKEVEGDRLVELTEPPACRRASIVIELNRRFNRTGPVEDDQTQIRKKSRLARTCWRSAVRAWPLNVRIDHLSRKSFHWFAQNPYAGLIAAAAFCLFGLTLLIALSQSSDPKPVSKSAVGQIISAKTECGLKASPEMKSRVLSRVTAKTKLLVLAEEGEWILVKVERNNAVRLEANTISRGWVLRRQVRMEF